MKTFRFTARVFMILLIAIASCICSTKVSANYVGSASVTVYFDNSVKTESPSNTDNTTIVDNDNSGTTVADSYNSIQNTVTISDTQTPLAKTVTILDEDTPLSSLPDLAQTGSNTLIPAILFALGIACLLARTKPFDL